MRGEERAVGLRAEQERRVCGEAGYETGGKFHGGAVHGTNGEG